MAEGSPTQKKTHPDNEDLEGLSKSELIARIREQEQHIKQLESKRAKLDRDDEIDAAASERLKQQQKDAARRENTLVHRLTTKEQELQDYINQISELKQAQTQGGTQLRSMLLDPAVNITFQRITKEMEEAQEKLKQTQNELSAWKFTPDSQTGKRLMARCQMLLQENEELGKTIASGRTAKLEGEIALQKTLVTEMKNNQSELDEFLGDLEEDVEGMQTMIYVLQQQLRDAKEQITTLETENATLRAGGDVPAASYQTFTVKKREKPDDKPSIKTEDTNHKDYSNNASTDHQEAEYSEMETGYYQNDKTDSDLEAEYNYEGLYENEDKYQEELEAQEAQARVAASTAQQEYTQSRYKDYEEEYEAEDFKPRHSATKDAAGGQEEHEAMEMEESNCGNNEVEMSEPVDSLKPHTAPADTHHTAPAMHEVRASSEARTSCIAVADATHRSDSEVTFPSRTEPTTLTHSDSSGQLIDSTSSEAESCQKRPVISVADQREDSTTATTSTSSSHSPPAEYRRTREITPPLETNCKEISTTKERSPEPERIPSPTTASTNNVNSQQQQVSHLDGQSNLDRHNGSPTNDRGSTKGKSSQNQLSPKDKHTEADSSANSCTAADSNSSGKDRSPVSSTFKEREPVLQKFLNGVTSTVDDIVDL